MGAILGGLETTRVYPRSPRFTTQKESSRPADRTGVPQGPPRPYREVVRLLGRPSPMPRALLLFQSWFCYPGSEKVWARRPDREGGRSLRRPDREGGRSSAAGE